MSFWQLNERGESFAQRLRRWQYSSSGSNPLLNEEKKKVSAATAATVTTSTTSDTLMINKVRETCDWQAFLSSQAKRYDVMAHIYNNKINLFGIQLQKSENLLPCSENLFETKSHLASSTHLQRREVEREKKALTLASALYPFKAGKEKARQCENKKTKKNKVRVRWCVCVSCRVWISRRIKKISLKYRTRQNMQMAFFFCVYVWMCVCVCLFHYFVS